MSLTTLLCGAPSALLNATIGSRYGDVPVDPSSDDATNWLLEELSKAPYQAARPTLFDRAAKAFSDWLNSLTIGDGTALPTLVLVILAALLTSALIAAIIVYGVPRLNRKSQHAATLFGETDDRTAAQLRTAAQNAAARDDYAAAVTDMFRSIARGLTERTIISMTPGTTAHGCANKAATALPQFRDELASSADTFDRVRYMRKPATRSQYEQIAHLEAHIRAAQPTLAEAAL
ncbi:MAG: DUF4129 domain-containing protein [Rhodoglobus sp.]